MIRYAATIFLGAFLIFAVQPMLGKYLLPWFGGGPAVWTACLLFFQLVLLCGYAYAHLLDSKLPPRRQAIVHLVLLSLSVALLSVLWWLWPAPVMPSGAFKPPDSGWPVPRILSILAIGVGLPYLLLSATSPLLQAWFRDSGTDRSPWKLYALSNAGSLLGLLAYPFVVEPQLGSVAQGRAWTALYLLFAGGLVLCAWPRLRRPAGAPSAAAAPSDPAPGLADRAMWFGLAACASVLLLAGTNQMCQEVAVMPFLWVLPLSLYLLTFILTFESDRIYGRAWATPLFFLAAAAATLALFREYELRIGLQVLIYSACIFFGCFACHGELVRAKPAASRLTGFYLIVSAGGAAGGVFVSLVAPVLFDGYWEFHLGLVGCAVLVALATWRERDSWLRGRWPVLRWSPLVLATLALGGFLVYHPIWYMDGVLWSSRNFYGVLRVKENVPSRAEYRMFSSTDLYDGQILHGFQLRDPKLRHTPTAYFSAKSGLGLALAHHPARAEGQPLSVGIIGLGVGTAAAHGRPGDRFRFYEINPDVIRLARGEGGFFSFLADSKAAVEIVEGDARISLESEWQAGQNQRFDLFVVDAFQSDAIPAHLLTREAFQLYFRHLKEDGLLVIHVTNLNLSLEPVVDRLATALDLVVSTVRDDGDVLVSLRSHWMLLTRDPMVLADPAIAEKASLPEQLEGGAPLWTDDHSSMLPILR